MANLRKLASLQKALREAEKQAKIAELDAQTASAKYEKYIGALSNKALMERWKGGIREDANSRNCHLWNGPKELFYTSDGIENRYDPRKLLTQFVAGPDIRPERVVQECGMSDCFNPSHFSVIDLDDLNDANFEKQVSTESDESGCLTWTGGRKFTVLHNWSSRSVSPREYLFSRIFPDISLRRYAFMSCKNELCVNWEHVSRRPTPEELQETRTIEHLKKVFSVVDRPGLWTEMDIGCLELTDNQIAELQDSLVFEGNGYSLIGQSEADRTYVIAWYCLAAVCLFRYGFYAFPMRFRTLGEVSSSKRAEFECKSSPRCISPHHRFEYLTKALNNASNNRFRNSNNENRLRHTTGLTQEQLLEALSGTKKS